MKWYNIFLVFCVIMCSVTNCASQKFQKTPPVPIDKVYKQSWHSGVKAGGSGTNIFVELTAQGPVAVSLDSIYFKTKQLALKQDSRNPLLYVARYINTSKQNYSNLEVGTVEKTSPENPKFQLKDNECVIQYTESANIRYYKYDAVFTKETPLVPGAKPRPQ